MNYEERWNIVDELGEGGQGKVYRVSNKLSDINTQNEIITSLRNITAIVNDAKIRNENFKNFKESILDLIKLDNPSNQFALKVLHDFEKARDSENAFERIKREINLMKKNLHPNLLKVIEVDD